MLIVSLLSDLHRQLTYYLSYLHLSIGRGQLRGDLVYAKYTQKLFRVILRLDGKGVIAESSPPLSLVNAKGGLGVTQAPDGSLLGVQYSLNQLWVHIPVEPATTEVQVYSVFPRRGPVAGGSTLTIYGSNLAKGVDQPIVSVGSFPCPVISATEKQIKCRLPGGSGTVDVAVSVGGESYTFQKGYRFITGLPL
jgi:IPT/TIG domain